MDDSSRDAGGYVPQLAKKVGTLEKAQLYHLHTHTHTYTPIHTHLHIHVHVYLHTLD